MQEVPLKKKKKNATIITVAYMATITKHLKLTKEKKITTTTTTTNHDDCRHQKKKNKNNRVYY